MITRSFLDATTAKVIGGAYRVVKGAEINYLGNDAEKQTDIILCAEVEASREWVDVERSLVQHAHAIELLELHLGIYANQPLKISKLSSPHREKMQNLQRKLEALNLSYVFQKKKKAELLEKAQNAVPGQVNILSQFFPGAAVHFGEAVFKSKEVIKGPFTIKYDPESKTLVQAPFEAFDDAIRNFGKKEKEK